MCPWRTSGQTTVLHQIEFEDVVRTVEYRQIGGKRGLQVDSGLEQLPAESASVSRDAKRTVPVPTNVDKADAPIVDESGSCNADENRGRFGKAEMIADR